MCGVGFCCYRGAGREEGLRCVGEGEVVDVFGVDGETGDGGVAFTVRVGATERALREDGEEGEEHYEWEECTTEE